MNLEYLRNKTILLFGKSRAFSNEEFTNQMKYHNIHIVKEYNEDIVLSVDGRMMTPYEQNASDELYENAKVKSMPIDILENMLACEIDEDTLLMSLKLSHDKDRLKSFLQNSTITNKLFFKLLKLYSWGGEDFFENDDNRDVTASLILRFYKNIERNHNIQYATSGLMHLIVQSNDEKLLEAIALLEPLQSSFNSNIKDINYNIVAAISTHHLTPKNILKMLIKKSNAYIKTLIAMRDDCDFSIQKILFENGDEEVLLALTYNSSLDKKIAKEMIKDEKYAKSISSHITLDDEFFDILVKNYSAKLAKNKSLSHSMQEYLIGFHEENVQLSLASNTHIDEDIIAKLMYEGIDDISFAIYANTSTPVKNLTEAYKDSLNHVSLANNKNTPKEILIKLSSSDDAKVLIGLAKNISTPIDVLYQLQLDSRFERAVKMNKTFAKYIQTQNIGWDI